MSELARTLTPKTATDPLVDQLVEEFARRVQSGAPAAADIEEFANQHPDQAAELRRILPAMRVLADLEATADRDMGSGLDRAAMEPLGDFRLVREIGRGGMGIVYEAEQLSLARRVAVKILPFAATLDPKHLQRFKNEAQAAGQLHHPSIVAVHFVGCERGVHFYAMQFIEGQSLAQMIADLRLQNAALPKKCKDGNLVPGPARQAPQSEICNLKSAMSETPPQGRLSTLQSTHSPAYFRTIGRLGIQAAQAVSYAHEVGIIHRDIKPANLLVDGRGNLWVTDFGLAQIRGDQKLIVTGDVVGTLRYMSPEQALAKHALVDHRTDIYSLGATLYELLTSEPAFKGTDRQELLRQITLDEPKPPRRHNKAIPPELETIVLKAMEKNPADRYATAQELADDLERFVKDEPIRARRASLRRRVKGWCRRHKALATGIVAMILSLLLLSGTVFWLNEQQHAEQERQRLASAEAVARDLEQAASWQRQEQWPLVLRALERAKAHLQGDEPSALRAEVEERWREVNLVTQLEEAQLVAAALVLPENKHDYAAADRAYATAFAEHGLDLVVLPTNEIARTIGASRIRNQFVIALDFWAFVKERLPGGDGEPLRAIARLVDDDPWRRKLRDPGLGQDVDALAKLIEGDEIFAQPPVTLLILSYALDKTKGKPAAAQLLRRAQAHYPSDFWLNFELVMHWDLMPETRDETIGFLRAALAVRPQCPRVHQLVGVLLWSQQKLPEATIALQKAIELQPTFADAHSNLGGILRDQGKLTEAETAFRTVIKLKPEDTRGHVALGEILEKQQKLTQAEDVCRSAIKLQPRNPDAYVALGSNLHHQHRLDEAVLVLDEAINLAPRHAGAYHNLGAVFLDMGQQKLPNAEAAFRRAIALDSAKKVHRLLLQSHQTDLAQTYNGLAVALSGQGKLHQAVEACQKAIAVNSSLPQPHLTLGNALRGQQKLAEAVKAYREAIRLDPELAEAHSNLGDTLREQGNLPEAVAALRQAIKLRPDLASAYLNLGRALGQHYKSPEAVGVLRTAIRLNPNFAEAHLNLGMALRDQGEFAESLASLKRAHELGSRRPDWFFPSAMLVGQAEQFAVLDVKLPKMLKGEIQPADAAERVALAALCQQWSRQFYAAAVRYYSEAFTAEPKLAENLQSENRYSAACAAALAGCGKGKDAATLSVAERARLRQQAAAWLQADLTAWKTLLSKAPQGVRPIVVGHMKHWQRDPDFDGVRAQAELAKLPEVERRQWQKLWQEVKELSGRDAQAK